MTHISRRDNLIPEVVPFYVKDRIRRDIGGYDRFDLVIPFAGFDFSRPEYDEDEYEDYYNEAIALGESCTDAAPETEATGEVRWDEDAVPESLDLSDESEGAGEGEEEELDDEIKEGITEEMEEEEPEEEGEDEEEILPFLSAIIERAPEVAEEEFDEEEMEESEEEEPKEAAEKLEGRLSLDEILESMLEGVGGPESENETEHMKSFEEVRRETEASHDVSIDHGDIHTNKCRSCGKSFCHDCANQVKSMKGYGNLSESMFNDYFEPLCLDCWEIFKNRLNEAKSEEGRMAKVQKVEEPTRLDESVIERGWKRRGEDVRMEEKHRRRKPKGIDERLRERIELLRKIRGLRWKVKRPEEEKKEIIEEMAQDRYREEDTSEQKRRELLRTRTQVSRKEVSRKEVSRKEVSRKEVSTREVREKEKYPMEEEDYDLPEQTGPESRIQNSVGMKFKLIPAGEFLMGSDRWEETQPVHRVNIQRPFYITIFPVTQGEWSKVMGINPGYPKGEHLPVVNVSWNDCKNFIEKLNEKEGVYKYRMPSETEWEYAARAGSTGRFYFGDDASLLPLYGWFGEDWDAGQLHPVGLKKPNEWGLYDIHGNVWEWCADKWHDNYIGAPRDGKAWLTGANKHRVRRGGTWANIPDQAETAYRNRNAPTYS